MPSRSDGFQDLSLLEVNQYASWEAVKREVRNSGITELRNKQK